MLWLCLWGTHLIMMQYPSDMNPHLTNCRKQSPYWEANSHSVSQEIQCLLQNAVVLYVCYQWLHSTCLDSAIAAIYPVTLDLITWGTILQTTVNAALTCSLAKVLVFSPVFSQATLTSTLQPSFESCKLIRDNNQILFFNLHIIYAP